MSRKPLLASPRALAAELAGLGRGLARMPTLALDWRTLPRGQGAPVLVLPGAMTTDRSTRVLREALTRLGHTCYGWELGRNHGNHRRLLPKVIARVDALADQHAAPLRLIGWSLGGMFAREAARARPDRVVRVVTLGTPVAVGPGLDVRLPVPITALYSKRDGVVPWQACLDPNDDNDVAHVEVDVTHLEFGYSAEVLRILAETLS